ncbi:methyltransferase domain-containing protein [Actinacidiphila paucisporea]|uniref:Protein-L-isoaspartate O-methyltransferase n=1 Tax=Actinacidiphila paucisporea TaxID=310782 RepID=A0A1M6WTI8_9ACTN|nr:methyltransferase domain-containing protein [Actinacidiphila paucisporea]SHK96951.1 protein-L-isoaspartate(D-aspartate) O-methyltransferase [Actinacidiphila paucisporea]
MAGSAQDQRFRAAAAALRHRMVRRIVSGGGLADPAWRAAFAEVPRHLFVPEYYRGVADGGYGRYAADEPDARRRLRWLTGAYCDQPIATHVEGGELVSSSSQPSLMALMCEALDVREGQRVLEIGAGTGYNAALLAHRLGGTGAVTTVDLDPAITASAREHLAAYGTPEALSVTVVTGDGALGWPPGAPYDRVIATCELPAVPPAWTGQCRPGARILAPFAAGLVLLTVLGPGRAEGRFLPTPAYFVPLRGRGAGIPPPAVGGDSSLPDRHPSRSRFGLTVEGRRQWIWLDSPQGPDTWPVPAARG